MTYKAMKYICPMHPHEQKEFPDICSQCGMTLEPIIDAQNTEYKQYLHQFLVALFFFILLAFIPRHISQYSGWIELLLTTCILFPSCWIFLKKGWFLKTPKKLNMFSLISLGIFSAYIDSACSVLFSSESSPLYFETAATITLLVLLGQILEKKARQRTSNAISLLLARAPQSAHILKDGLETDIAIHQVQIGDVLLVKPGDKIPTDGIVIRGSSAVDESLFTGEPIPVEKKQDSTLIGGTINQSGSLIMKAERVGADTALMHMIQLVLDAQQSKAPIQKIADTVSSYFIPIILCIAVGTFFYWEFFSSLSTFQFALLNAVSVLIVACPCALGLATPLSLTVGIGKGSTLGIFFKSGESIENLARIDTVVLDKTGTLTEGHPYVTGIYAHTPYQNADILQYAASLETMSSHPLAKAIIKSATDQNIALKEPEHFVSYAGMGIQGIVNEKEIAVGNQDFIAQHTSIMPTKLDHYSDSTTRIYISIDKIFAGFLSIVDPIKTTSPATVRMLKDMGLTVSMLTGDSISSAQEVANQLNITTFRASFSPEDKCTFIKNLQHDHHFVAMVGDGVNDAPALATSNVGIAVAKGTDVAIESASVVLTKDDPQYIVKSIDLSRKIMCNIRQNLFFAFLYNIAAIPIAAGVLYSHFHLVLNPVIASAAMALSSLCVVGNALRLR